MASLRLMATGEKGETRKVRKTFDEQSVAGMIGAFKDRRTTKLVVEAAIKTVSIGLSKSGS